MKKMITKNIGYIVFAIFLLFCLVAMMLRVDQLNSKKELPVARQSNSANF